MKKRIKTQLLSKYHPKPKIDGTIPSEETVEFEESLKKLSDFNKNKIRISEFTARDKVHLLDLFVNSERTLVTIFETLFPKQSIAQ